MADPRFFSKPTPRTLADIAALTGASLSSGSSPDLLIEDVAPLDSAGPGHISFLDNVRYRDQFAGSRASACVVAPDMADRAPAGMALLLTPTPYKAYALAAQAFYPDRKPAVLISPQAHVDPAARLGEGTVVEAGAVIGPGVEIGRDCRIGATAVVSHALIGDRVRIYPGCCIGQDGFGFAIDPAGFIKVPQLGRVIIGDGVEIGANTTIDRGAGPDTVIGPGTWIDNLVQIGHNVKIGRNCVIVSQVGISGSTVIGDLVMIGGQAGITGHLTIGKGAKIGAQSGVMQNIEPGAEVLGSPAMPLRRFMRQVAYLNRLIKKDKS